MHEPKNQTAEYIKFAFVMAFIVASSLLIFDRNDGWMGFAEALMGVFFLVFGGFKLINIREFAYGFQTYDIIATKSLLYSYVYPFIQLTFAFIYLFGFGTIFSDGLVLLVSLVSGYGVLKKLRSKQQIHCVCLGNVIKLPLSTVTLIEDFGMAAMAVAMLIGRL